MNPFEEENKVSRSIPYAVAKSCKDIMISKGALRRVHDLFLEELETVLSKSAHEEDDIRCYLTPMPSLPSGKEKGRTLALHYEGEFMQLVSMNLFGNRMFDMMIQIYPLPIEVLEGTIGEVLAFAAECTDDFIATQNLTKFLPMAMGVTVNLPLRYDDEGRKVFIAKNTDQFPYPEALEQNMVEILEDSLDKLGVDVDIVAFLSSSSSTMISNYYKNPDCRISLIIGDGTKLCYIEDVEKVKAASKIKKATCILVDIDNGEFGLKGELDFLKAEIDIELEGLNPDQQVFEKIVSGRMIGELVRLKLKELVSKNLMLRGIGSSRLSTPNNFRREYVILVENDDNTLEQTQKVAQDLDLNYASKTDLAIIKYVCKLMIIRSARLVAAATAALITKLNLSEVIVGVEGTLLHFNPFYEFKIHHALEYLMGQSVKLEFMASENGPAKGGCIAAGLAITDADNAEEQK